MLWGFKLRFERFALDLIAAFTRSDLLLTVLLHFYVLIKTTTHSLELFSILLVIFGVISILVFLQHESSEQFLQRHVWG